MMLIQRTLAVIAILLAVGQAGVAQSGPSTRVAPSGQGSDLFQKALSKERAEGQLQEAIALYERIVAEFASDRALVAKALVQLGRCYQGLGRPEARSAYDRVVREFADQRAAVVEARARLAEIDRPPLPGAGAMTARRVWVGRDVTVEGQPSADGRYLSYLDQNDLAIRDLHTGQIRRLLAKRPEAATTEFAEASVPSPDGSRIVYQWFNSADFYELRTIGLTDATPRVLFSDPGAYVSPAAWSPDGKQVLAVITRDNTTQLAWVSTVDRSVRPLRTLDWRYPLGVRLSPDGRFIVYDTPTGTEPSQRAERDIVLLHADGSHEVALVRHPAYDTHPIFTPDGTSVLFVSDRSGVNGLWTIRVSDGKPQGSPELVKPSVGNTLPLGFTRAGAFYYAAFAGGSDVYVAPLDPATGRRAGEPTAIADRFVGANTAPEWSPDGTSLVYLAQRTVGYGPPREAGRMTVRTVATGAERVVPVALHRMLRPRWAPDGERILVSGADDQKGEFGFYAVDAGTGAHRRVIPRSEGDKSEAEWSADGRAIFYHLRDAAGSHVMRQALDSNVARELYRAAGAAGLAGLSVSPDGGRLAFRITDAKSGAAVLVTLPIDGGEPTEIVRLGKGETIPASILNGPIAWTPDGAALLYVKRLTTGDERENELWRVPLDTKRPEPIGLAMKGLREVRIRPDGRAIAVAAGQGQREIWVMENFLPSSPGAATNRNAKQPR
jgi:Tol biopolymer transport system component